MEAVAHVCPVTSGRAGGSGRCARFAADGGARCLLDRGPPAPRAAAGPAPGGLGAEATAEALAGAALAGVLLQAAPAWAPRALEPYLRGVLAALAGPQAAAARRNGRFLALVEARARAPAGRHRRSGNFAYVHHAAVQDAVLAARPCAAALHRDEGHAGMQGRAQPLRAQHRPQSRRRTAAAPRRAPRVRWPAAAPRRRGATCWRARWPRSRARWARCWAATRRPRRARWTSGWPPSSRGAAPPAVGLE